MATQFDVWLREQARTEKGGVVLAAASRGRKYTLPINLPASYQGATLAGRVRAAPDATGDPLATFAVSSPVVAAGVATFTCTLAEGSGADSTGALPADGDLDGVEYFPVEFELTPDGEDEAELLFAGLLPVSGSI